MTPNERSALDSVENRRLPLLLLDGLTILDISNECELILIVRILIEHFKLISLALQTPRTGCVSFDWRKALPNKIYCCLRSTRNCSFRLVSRLHQSSSYVSATAKRMPNVTDYRSWNRALPKKWHFSSDGRASSVTKNLKLSNCCKHT